jgi:hypothetical protein
MASSYNRSIYQWFSLREPVVEPHCLSGFHVTPYIIRGVNIHITAVFENRSLCHHAVIAIYNRFSMEISGKYR